MSLIGLLQRDQSKVHAEHIVGLVIKGEYTVGQLLEVLYDSDMRLRQKVSWPLLIISEKYGALLEPYIDDMIAALEAADHDSLLRNIFRVWQPLHFDDEHSGKVYDIAFEYFSNPENAIAVRVFAMSVCANIAVGYPELAQELIVVIEEGLPHGSAGYISRARKELKRLYKTSKSQE